MATIDIGKLKNIGMMQNTYMFHINIPTIPFIGANNLEFYVRSSKIPGRKRDFDTIRFLGEQYNLPGGRTWNDGSEWTVNVLIDENHSVLDQLIKWFDAIRENAVGLNVQSIKTTAYCKLLGLDKENTSKRFKINGIFILNIPPQEFDQTNTSGHINVGIRFAYDDVDWDQNNVLNF